MPAKIDLFTDEEFTKLVGESSSMLELAKKLGYTSHSGSNGNRIRYRIDQLKLSTDHFNLGNRRPIKRTIENIFIENSTADQKTLRKYYKEEQYTEYKCSICNLEPFWNNKELTLILDHINGKNHDDRIENLRWVCPNCNQQLDTTNGKNKNHGNKNINYCIDCGKIISNKSIRCQKCASLQRDKQKINRIEKELLKQLIREKTFTEIGNMFNVSSNAVKKWCDFYKLPRKKCDIKKYTDEEWANI